MFRIYYDHYEDLEYGVEYHSHIFCVPTFGAWSGEDCFHFGAFYNDVRHDDRGDRLFNRLLTFFSDTP